MAEAGVSRSWWVGLSRDALECEAERRRQAGEVKDVQPYPDRADYTGRDRTNRINPTTRPWEIGS